jgi:hypothetical protein
MVFSACDKSLGTVRGVTRNAPLGSAMPANFEAEAGSMSCARAVVAKSAMPPKSSPLRMIFVFMLFVLPGDDKQISRAP